MIPRVWWAASVSRALGGRAVPARVVCLPPAMNHPVKVAERIATLDILSGGRVHFGMGKGGTQQEAGTFGYDLNELQPMIDESMYLILQQTVGKGYNTPDAVSLLTDYVRVYQQPAV